MSGFEDKEHHISEQSDGSTEQNLESLGRVEEKIETKVNDDDGIIEDHITYIPMQASQWVFGNADNPRYAKNYEDIDWSDDGK